MKRKMEQKLFENEPNCQMFEKWDEYSGKRNKHKQNLLKMKQA